MSVVEIEEAISNLSVEEFARIRDWFAECDQLLWDKQMTDDGFGSASTPNTTNF